MTGTAVTLSLLTTSAVTAATVNFGNTDYPSQAMTLAPFSGHGTGYNLGIGGQTCSQIALRYAADAHPLSPAVTGKSGYLFVECGTNAEGSFTPTCTGTSGGSSVVCSSVTGIDVGEIITGTGIGAGATVATTWTGSTTIPLTVANSAAVSGTITFASTPTSIVSNIARVWALGRADGYKVIASTTPYHYGSSAQRQENDAYNLLILAARSSYDYVMDVHAKLTDYTDTSLWSADGIHFTNSGYGVIAQQAANALQTTGGDLFGPTPGYFRTYGTGTQNTRLSISALYSQTTGSNDIGAGEFAGGVCTTCTNSLFFGPSAGGQAISGDGGFFMGPLTGQNITAVSQQVMIGKQAGGAATNASVNSVGVGAFALAFGCGWQQHRHRNRRLRPRGGGARSIAASVPTQRSARAIRARYSWVAAQTPPAIRCSSRAYHWPERRSLRPPAAATQPRWDSRSLAPSTPARQEPARWSSRRGSPRPTASSAEPTT